MASPKSTKAKVKTSTDKRTVFAVCVDLDQLERLYSHTRLVGGRKHSRDDGKRDDGDGIRRDDTF